MPEIGETPEAGEFCRFVREALDRHSMDTATLEYSDEGGGVVVRWPGLTGHYGVIRASRTELVQENLRILADLKVADSLSRLKKGQNP